MTIRSKIALFALVSTFGICQSAMSINISESDLPGGLELDGTQSYILDLGTNTIEGWFAISKFENNPGVIDYEFDIDNFSFVVGAGHQLDSMELTFFDSDISGTADWGNGSLNYVLDSPTGIEVRFPGPTPTIEGFDPHSNALDPDYPETNILIGAFPFAAGTYRYEHSLLPDNVDDADFEKVTTRYMVSLDVSLVGQGVPDPVPDSGSTILFSILGLSCLFAAKRFTKK